MRPHRLRVSAFGAFPGTEELDLDRLGGSGLFLLQGPTGAGKSTLLDAIGYALYGALPGARQQAKRLRSDHADPSTHTEVELELTAAGRRLRITRSPDYERPKARGSGTTTQAASVRLDERGPDGWREVSRSSREVGDVVLDVVGMSADQFFQVVLLPQGGFATFLHAPSVDRAALLERLFGTQRFDQLQSWLAGRRRTTEQAVTAARAEVTLRATRLAHDARTELPAEVDLDWAEEVLLDLQAAATRTRQVAEVADAQVRARRAELERSRTAVGVHEDRAAAAEVLLAAHDGAAADAQTRDALARALAAAPLRAALDDDAAHPALDGPRLAAELDRARARLDAAAAAVTRLEAAAPLLDAWRGAQRALAVALAECEAAEATAQAAPGAVEEAYAVLAAAREAARVATEARDALPAVEASTTAVAELLAARAAHEVARAEHAAARDDRAAAWQHALERRAAVLDIDTARHAHAAAALRDLLTPGGACAVCGCDDRDHERPALDTPDTPSGAPSEAARERAVAAAQEAEDARSEAERAFGGAERALDAAAVRLAQAAASTALPADVSGEETDAHLRLRLAEVEAEAARLRPLAADVAGATETLDAARLAHARAVTQAELAAQALVAATAAVTAARDQCAQAARPLQDVLDPRGSHATTGDPDPVPDLAVVMERAQEEAAGECQAAGAAVQELEAQATAQARRAAAAATLQARLQDAGFASAAEARDAWRDPAWVVDTGAALQRHDEQVLLARATWQRLEGALLEGEPPQPEVAPDWPARTALLEAPGALLAARAEHDRAVTVLAEAEAAARAVTAEATTAAGAHRAALEQLPALQAALEALAPVQQAHDTVAHLAELTAGTNPHALPLSHFVLAARLAQVAEVASDRLQQMSDGRYTLSHTEEKAERGRRSGLGLQVHDAWTGRSRDTRTLSGGESFLASLALALGLSDVVSAEAGGARIEALFVDEGFGSLDDEALDRAMETLDALRAGGRVVGVVSHVPLLRERIPTQVRVHRHPDGSTLELLAP